jgi:hypothetical protein
MITPAARGTFAANIVMPILAIFAVGLRLFARRIKSQPFQLDDWTIIVALVCAVAICVEGIYACTAGLLGVLFEDMTLETYQNFRKILFVDEMVVDFILGLVKLSVLFFYKRIFTTAATFRLAANIMIAVVIAWMITAFFGLLFSSHGVSTFWTTPPQLDLTEYNINLSAFNNAMSAIDIVLDVVILSLPIPVIKRLHMVGGRKLSLMGVFSLGAFCVISSSVRLYYVHSLLSYAGADGALRTFYSDSVDLWGHVEACASIIASCLPTLGPLFAARSPQSIVNSVRSIFSIRSGSVFSVNRQQPKSSGDSQSSAAAKNVWIELNNTERTTGSGVATDLENQKKAVRGIVVERSFNSQETVWDR